MKKNIKFIIAGALSIVISNVTAFAHPSDYAMALRTPKHRIVRVRPDTTYGPDFDAIRDYVPGDGHPTKFPYAPRPYITAIDDEGKLWDTYSCSFAQDNDFDGLADTEEALISVYSDNTINLDPWYPDTDENGTIDVQEAAVQAVINSIPVVEPTWDCYGMNKPPYDPNVAPDSAVNDVKKVKVLFVEENSRQEIKDPITREFKNQTTYDVSGDKEQIISFQDFEYEYISTEGNEQGDLTERETVITYVYRVKPKQENKEGFVKVRLIKEDGTILKDYKTIKEGIYQKDIIKPNEVNSIDTPISYEITPEQVVAFDKEYTFVRNEGNLTGEINKETPEIFITLVYKETPEVETPPVEQPPVETPPVEQPPVETPVENPPVDTPPVDIPLENPPVEQPQLEPEIPTQEIPKEDIPKEEIPKEEIPREHITKFIDKEGNIIENEENSKVGPKPIPKYVFIETREEEGLTIHVYRKVKTSFITVEKEKLADDEEGLQKSKTFNNYTLVETNDLENGDREHVYKPIKPVEPKPEVPNLNKPQIDKPQLDKPQVQTGTLDNVSILLIGMLISLVGLKRIKE